MGDFAAFRVQGTGGERIVAEQDEGVPVPLVLLIFPGCSRVGFFVSEGVEAFCLAGDAAAGAAVSVRLERHGGAVHFVHWWDKGVCLGVLPAGGGRVGFGRRLSGGGSLCLGEAVAVPAALAEVADEIAALIAPPARWRTVFEALRGGRLRVSLAAAVLRVLPLDELRDLAAHLLDDAADLAMLQRAMGDNVSVVQRLAALASWPKVPVLDDHCARVATLAEGADLQGAAGARPHLPDLGLALNALARRCVRPRRMACVLGSARNEGPYLLEWIAYHRSIGFDHVFLYTNDNTDGSDALLSALAAAGVITWFRNELGPHSLPQFKAYAHALSVMPEILDYRWTLIADLDEYFGFDSARFASARDFLDWQDGLGADAVAMPWLLHVARPGDVWRDESSIARFVWRVETVNHHVKSVFRTSRFWASNPHHPAASLGLPVTFLAETGLPHIALPPEGSLSLSANPVARHAWIAHHIFRSAPEALMKLRRGKGDGPAAAQTARVERILVPYLALTFDRKLVADRRTLRCAAGLAAELAHLRAIPGVAAAVASIQARWQRSMREAVAETLDGSSAADSDDLARFHAVLRGLAPV